MSDNLDPATLLDSFSKFFDVSRNRLVLIFSIMLAAAFVGAIDYNEHISDVPRWMLVFFYIFGGICVIFLTVNLGLHLFDARKLRLEIKRQRADADNRDIELFRVASNLHRACLIYIKQQGRRRFNADDWITLRQAVGLGLLMSQHAAQNVVIYEVPDALWNSNELIEASAQMAPIVGPPWVPVNMGLYRGP